MTAPRSHDVRYAPDRPLPAYAHRLGKTPHPRRDPHGHSFGARELPHRAFDARAWRDDEAYRFAIDLLNRGFAWEAHEELEALWRGTTHEPERTLLRALVQACAAELQLERGRATSARTLAARASEALCSIARDHASIVAGIDLADVADRLERDLRARVRLDGA